MSEKMLGKIKRVSFGYCGYEGVQFGFQVELGGDNWGVCAPVKGFWSLDIPCNSNCKWTEEDRDRGFAEAVRELNKLLLDARKKNINDLVGVPVEVEFNGTAFVSFRVLKEVL